MDTAESVERAIAPVVSSAGLELVDVEAGPGRVRVTIDREGGIDLDAISSATADISRALDRSGAIGDRYELEVSSPGVERRLRRHDHFERCIGTEIAVKTRPEVEGERRVQGRLAEVDAEGFRLEGPSLGETGRRLQFSEVATAKSIFDWQAALAGTSVRSARAARRHHSGALTAPRRPQRPPKAARP